MYLKSINEFTVACHYQNGMFMSTENLLLTLLFPAPPAAPGNQSVTFTFPGQQFTITWNEPPLDTGAVDAYFVNISGPDYLCGNVSTLQRVITHSYTCSGWMMPTGQKYIFTVAAANCGGSQTGPERDPITVCLQGMCRYMISVLYLDYRC